MRMQLATSLAAALVMAVPARAIPTFDSRSSTSLVTTVQGTGIFSVSRMNIPFQEVTQATGMSGFSEKAINNMFATYLNSNNDGSWSQAQKLVISAAEISALEADFLIAAAWVSFGTMVEILAADHLTYVSYSFNCPVDAVYTINAHLTGGIDKPRNRVTLAGPEGTIQLADDNPSSSVDRLYSVSLRKGTHTLAMALGSGSSSLFHNVGNLNWVQMNNPTRVNWTSDMTLWSNGTKLTDVMPAVGNNWNPQWSVAIPTTLPGILEGAFSVDPNSIVAKGGISPKVVFRLTPRGKDPNGDPRPANFINSNATFMSRPGFVLAGGTVTVNQSATRTADTTDLGDID